MKIIENKFTYRNELTKRTSTKYIVLHHRAGNGNVESIHRQHLNQGYSGIGYHFYIRKDGSIYSGRPQDTVGAHALNYNSQSVGVCFEGNFELEEMTFEQLNAGRELLKFLKKMYGSAEIKMHRELGKTACPGKFFPFDAITKKEEESELVAVNDIVWELSQRGIISDKILWLNKLAEDKNTYFLAQKMVKFIMQRGI